MNKKLILIALSVAMFCSASYAQKVIKQGNAVIIDCSNMDPIFYDPNPKPRTTNANNSLPGTNDATQISSEVSDAKVYKIFEIKPNDEPVTADWLGAVNLCAGLKADGGGWRLPTMRELMLIWIFKEKLVANGCTPFANSRYWSATKNHRYNSGRSQNVNFSNGMTVCYDTETTTPCKVRCIRDI